MIKSPCLRTSTLLRTSLLSMLRTNTMVLDFGKVFYIMVVRHYAACHIKKSGFVHMRSFSGS